MTTNQKIAAIFYQMADYLEMDNVAFKPAAYRVAAENLTNLAEDVSEIYRRGGEKALEQLPGIGQNLAAKIIEYLKTGRIEAYEKLKKKIPVNLEELRQLEGLGPKRIKILYEKLGVKTVADLKDVLLKHKVAKLFGFGQKTETNLMLALGLSQKPKKRFLLAEIEPLIKKTVKFLKALKEVEQVVVAGSVRRQKKDIGDIDILVISANPKAVMEAFVKMPGVIKVWGVGETKASVTVNTGCDIDLRIVSKDSFGAALLYFTGSKEYNIFLRKLAQKKGLKLNEYGLFSKNKKIAGKTEEEIFQALGLAWVSPEKREI